MRPMTIGELARRAGVGVETVRFYQRQGLLEEPPRGRASRRAYTSDHLADLRFIRRCKGLGFSLKTIAKLVDQRAAAGRGCRTLHGIMLEAVHALEAERREIEMRRKALLQMLGRCEAGGRLRDCATLAALDEESHRGGD